MKVLSSLNDDPSKRVDFLIEDEHGLYRQGITYMSQPEMAEGDPTRFNYVTDYKHLGGGWYYYVFHYDKVDQEELYRELAWSKLSDKERNTLTTPKEKTIVTVEAGTNVGQWNNEKKLNVVVSVTFTTEMDGLLGPITMFFDPVTKELVGGNIRF